VQIAAMSPTLPPSQNQPLPLSPPVRSFVSRIISGFPEIFTEFRGKQFSLLWRGNRDSFKAEKILSLDMFRGWIRRLEQMIDSHDDYVS
jgi:hypothetical protein